MILAVSARTIREVAALAALARRAGKRLTTISLDTQISFATPAVREAFGNDLVKVMHALIAKYHDSQAPDGRAYRLFAGAHPVFVPAPPSKPRARTSTRREKK